jgi:urease accessory protein
MSTPLASQPAASPPLALLRLLQLASPTLPVGAYSYSQGLEAAVAAGLVHDEASARRWIAELMQHVSGRLEAPILLRLSRAWVVADEAQLADWNDRFLATRESAELRAETLQMGYSLKKLLEELTDAAALVRLDRRCAGELAYPTAFAFAAWAWAIPEDQALLAYLWSWLENQVLAAMKSVPLGQSAGQRILYGLGADLAAVAGLAQSLEDQAIGALAPQLAMLSAAHETQYSRLFRS